MIGRFTDHAIAAAVQSQQSVIEAPETDRPMRDGMSVMRRVVRPPWRSASVASGRDRVRGGEVRGGSAITRREHEGEKPEGNRSKRGR